MERREFLGKTSAAALYFSCLPILDTLVLDTKAPIVPQTDTTLMNNFLDLLNWMQDNGWGDYIKNELEIGIQIGKEIDVANLTRSLSNIYKILEINGLEDFAGDKLIEPGAPSKSLLYHIIASPRVKSNYFKEYPNLNQIDIAENYIFSLRQWENYLKEKSNIYIAVLAYEYRPAYKVPPFDPTRRSNSRSANFVFSRCGIARIGDKPSHYDKENRCFTNLPSEKGFEKNIAVMPARYGLFWVELVDSKNETIAVMNLQDEENSMKNRPRHFIKPICKIYERDSLSIKFGEFHVNEKLKKLSDYEHENKKINFFSNHSFERPPFIRVSSYDDLGEKLVSQQLVENELVNLKKVGSSVLLHSIPNQLIREAKQDGEPVYIKVPPFWKKRFHESRRYGALKLADVNSREVQDVTMTDFIYRRNRRTSRFRAPKNYPLFVNIKYKKSNSNIIHLDGETIYTVGSSFEQTLKSGNYYALLFEDNICDGCVAAKLDINDKISEYFQLINRKSHSILPAFSLVTAPDFFPSIDSNDIRSYYFNNSDNLKVDEDFLEGGTINLSGIRQRGNPNILNPFTLEKAFAEDYLKDKSFDTLTAVVSLQEDSNSDNDDFLLSYDRDYQATSFLPDTGTGIFFPGWDATYSGNTINPFLATFGLGSPFLEDMKLCAAANGMWPVSSPDTARTFQGSLESFPILGKPYTSIPLMDVELGLHKDSSYVKDYAEQESLGWDGEQGPFLQLKGKNIVVNYTDIERADYIKNFLDPNVGFNMSITRNLNSSELIDRMDCHRRCIKNITNREKQSKKTWLICAESIDNWSDKQVLKCIPKSSDLNNLSINQRQNHNLNGKGYFFVFVSVKKNNKGTFVHTTSKSSKPLISKIL